MNFLIKLKTLYSLGLISIFRVVFYRLGVRFGFNPVKKIQATPLSGDYFFPYRGERIFLEGNTQWLHKQTYFGWFTLMDESIPDWHKNIFDNVSAPELATKPWWTLPDFIPQLGDIKTVWEASRFDWVLCFAQATASGDTRYLQRLNDWINDWVKKNPFYCGLNWKCGQEASIRVMHLACAAIILGQHTSSSKPLLNLIKAHLKRIAPTIQYAMAQNNNHGTSEAAALYIGGSWLALNGDVDGNKWFYLGRKWLENRAIKLIEKDGTFSQYSVIYHRVMLDTYSFVELWRNKNGFPVFSDKLYSRLKAATNWLYQMTSVDSGGTPNLGANDGARLFSLCDSDYRDSRPSVQTAMVLFHNCSAWGNDGVWNLPLKWLGIHIPANVSTAQESCKFNHGGYSLFRNNSIFALFVRTRYKFRPSQCDVLHLDIWIDGINVLRDAGTYSYNTSSTLMNYFGGTAAHNTIQFDNEDQMPRVSRFLLGDWIKVIHNNFANKFGSDQLDKAGYIGRVGSHFREVEISQNCIKVKDTVKNFRERAVLRWRLSPGSWQLKENILTNNNIKIVVSTDTDSRLEYALTVGLESRYYLQKSEVPVLEVISTEAGNLYTEIYLSS